MKKYLMFLLIMIVLFPIYINAEINSDYSYFYKKDEQGNYIEDAEFKIKSIDGKTEYDVIYDSEYKAYKYRSFYENDYEKIVKFAPSDILETVNSFHTPEDFDSYTEKRMGTTTISDFKNFYVECHYYASAPGTNPKGAFVGGEYSVRKIDTDKYSSCEVEIPTVIFLEETKTPKGLEKEKMALAAFIRLYYIFDYETQDITQIDSELRFGYNRVFYDTNNTIIEKMPGMAEYDKNINYNNIESVYNYFANYEGNDKYSFTDCVTIFVPGASSVVSSNESYKLLKVIEPTNIIRTGEDFQEIACTLIIIDKSGTSELGISSYVNSAEEVSISETSTVEIKVFLANDGKAPSYDNVIVSHVPEGVEYVSGSATDNGIYSEENNTVTWNLDYLDANDGYMFAYNVVVPSGTPSSVFVTTSSVSAYDTSEPIESNEAKVTTSSVGDDTQQEEVVSNPKTGDTRSQLLITLLIVSVAILTYSLSHRSFKL